jgi:hypothetical protein
MGILLLYLAVVIKVDPYKYKWQLYIDILQNTTILISILLA